MFILSPIRRTVGWACRFNGVDLGVSLTQPGGAEPTHVERRQHIRHGLQGLRPDIPWTHLIDLHGIKTISPVRGGKWFKKAEGLGHFGEIAIQLARTVGAGQTLQGKSVLDLGCGEGGHAIKFAQAGANRVLGLDGRGLAIERGRFAASVLGVSNIEFLRKDVRVLDGLTEPFDFVLCSGILHHINSEEWFPFLKNVARLTADTAIIYTHVADELLRAEHKLIPTEINAPPDQSTFRDRLAQNMLRVMHRRRQPDIFEGYLYREHRDDETPEDKSCKMRASLDNAQSFWATEESLVEALRKCGFQLVFKVQAPHMFRMQRFRNTRQIIVARKSC